MIFPGNPSTWKRAEIYLILLGAFVGMAMALQAMLQHASALVLPSAGALVALMLAFLCGTRLYLPVYFLTTFGTVLTMPGLPGFLSLNRLAALGLLLAIIVETPAARHRLALTSAVLLFFAFQLYYLPLTLLKAPPEASFPVESLFYIVLTVLVAIRYWSRPWMTSLLWSFVIITVLMMVIPGGIELATGQNITPRGFAGSIGRINGLSVNAIIYATYGLWALPIAGMLFVESRQLFTKILLLGGIGGICVLSILTLNRQTPIIMVAVIFVFLCLVRYRYRKLMLGVFLTAAVLAVPVVAIKLAERFSTTNDYRRDASLAVRRDKALISYELLRKNPLTGIGHNHFRYEFKRNRPLGELFILHFQSAKEQYIDLGWMQIATEYGLIGFLMIMALLYACAALLLRLYLLSWQLADPWWTNLFAMIAAIFAHLLISLCIQDMLVTPRTYLLFGLFFAATTGFLRLVREGEAAP